MFVQMKEPFGSQVIKDGDVSQNERGHDETIVFDVVAS